MNGEQLFRLLGQVDDRWIEEAACVRRSVPWKKFLLSAAACLCLAAVLYTGLTRPAAPPDGGDVQVGNPMESWETAEALSQAVGFEVPLPTQLPEGYDLESFSSISRQIAEVCWSDGEGRIIYRVSAELEDISGDYVRHSRQTEIQAGGSTVTLLGDDQGWVTAVWTAGELHCALLVQPGQTEEGLREIITSIQ